MLLRHSNTLFILDVWRERRMRLFRQSSCDKIERFKHKNPIPVTPSKTTTPMERLIEALDDFALSAKFRELSADDLNRLKIYMATREYAGAVDLRQVADVIANCQHVTDVLNNAEKKAKASEQPHRWTFTGEWTLKTRVVWGSLISRGVAQEPYPYDPDSYVEPTQRSEPTKRSEPKCYV
jgi:hypothetical protein